MHEHLARERRGTATAAQLYERLFANHHIYENIDQMLDHIQETPCDELSTSII